MADLRRIADHALATGILTDLLFKLRGGPPPSREEKLAVYDEVGKAVTAIIEAGALRAGEHKREDAGELALT